VPGVMSKVFGVAFLGSGVFMATVSEENLSTHGWVCVEN
jgi:hypothetical protein